MSEKIIQTAGREVLGDFAPEFAHFNDDVLFGENWNNEDIDLKTRCIITVTSLMSQGITDSSLKYHLENAKAHGVTKKEIAAIVTHLSFYTSWANAWAVFRLAKELWTEEDKVKASSDKDRFQREIIFPIGEPNDAYAKYFVGQSYLAPVSTEQISLFNVTFEPGYWNSWHIHHASSGGGQLLICIGGRGWYQEEGKTAVELIPGKVINIPANVKHWHGAAADSWMSHLAAEISGEDTSTEWCELVSDEEYSKVN
ncbi:MAG: carboxymuconolactone decarboxylase family protein [Clostridia bacterium]|nr:carboxymuconolactone decarboxylase family protein [Clostridia bacterium]